MHYYVREIIHALDLPFLLLLLRLDVGQSQFVPFPPIWILHPLLCFRSLYAEGDLRCGLEVLHLRHARICDSDESFWGDLAAWTYNGALVLIVDESAKTEQDELGFSSLE